MDLKSFPLKRIRYIILLTALVFLSIILASCGTKGTAVDLGGEGLEPAPQNLVVQVISIDQAYQRYQDQVAFLDVRTPGEWNEAHIPGSTLLPLDELEDRVDELPRDLELVVYCRSGNRSAQGARILLEAGFSDVYSMDGGLNDWISAGYVVDPGN